MSQGLTATVEIEKPGNLANFLWWQITRLDPAPTFEYPLTYSGGVFSFAPGAYTPAVHMSHLVNGAFTWDVFNPSGGITPLDLGSLPAGSYSSRLALGEDSSYGWATPTIVSTTGVIKTEHLGATSRMAFFLNDYRFNSPFSYEGPMQGRCVAVTDGAGRAVFASEMRPGDSWPFFDGSNGRTPVPLDSGAPLRVAVISGTYSLQDSVYLCR